MRLFLIVKTDTGKEVFTHQMFYRDGKLKFIPAGKAIKEAIKEYLKTRAGGA